MNDKIYTITLEDGTVIDGLHLNGNNFISQEEIKPEIFDGNLAEVHISDGETDEVHYNMALVQIIPFEDNWWFVLRDIPKNELEMSRLRSELDYLSMMTNVEL